MRHRIVWLLAALLAPVCVVGVAHASTDASSVEVPVSATGRYIVQLRSGTDADVFINDLGLRHDGLIVYRSVFPGFAGSFDAETMHRIAADLRVDAVDADEVITGSTTRTTGPVVSGAPDSGVVPVGLDRIDQRTDPVDHSYTYSNDGSGVDVYVFDTGVYAAHSEFGSRVANGWSYRANDTLRGSAWSTLGSCKTNNASTGYVYSAAEHPYDVDTFDHPTVAGDVTAAQADVGKTDNEGHGTHVAAIVGGTSTGVAPGVTIYPVRILNSCGNGLTSLANAGLDWVISQHTTGRAVVNMSIGFDNKPSSFETRVTSLMAEGVTVVAAAGNSAGSACNSAPAATAGTISVGAVGVTATATTETWYSNYGSCVDIFAPGGAAVTQGGNTLGTTSAWLDTSNTSQSPYRVESGTSMAAPHVVGVVAQWLQGLASAPVSKATGPDAAWSWLKKQATCDAVTYYSTGRTEQTPNRLLYAGSSATTPCAPKNVSVTQASGSSVVSWDDILTGNGNDITGYAVTTSPATTGCTATESSVSASTGRAQCTLTGLTDGATYSVTVRATYGSGSQGTAAAASLVAGVSGVPTTAAPTTTTTEAPTTTTTVPDPVTPTSATTSATGNSLTISWPAVNVSGTVEYTVTITPGGVSCTTRSTSCTFVGVRSGTNYSFTITARNVTGVVSGSSYSFTTTAGFSVKLQMVKVRSRTLLTRIVTSPSKGRRTYRVISGKCTISAGRLVAPVKAGTCRFRVSVARSGTYPAMSTTVKLVVVG